MPPGATIGHDCSPRRWDVLPTDRQPSVCCAARTRDCDNLGDRHGAGRGKAMTINDVATHRLGAGEVSLDRHGHLVQVTRGDGRPMLLDECTEFDRVIHGPASRFGTGLLVWHTEDDTL